MSKSVYKLRERELPPSAVCAEFQVQAGLHDIDVGSDIDWKRRHRPDWTECAAAEAHAVIIAETVVVVFNEEALRRQGGICRVPLRTTVTSGARPRYGGTFSGNRVVVDYS